MAEEMRSSVLAKVAERRWLTNHQLTTSFHAKSGASLEEIAAIFEQGLDTAHDAAVEEDVIDCPQRKEGPVFSLRAT